jgi:mannose-6-phosphate isomerase-like protein (cupin superfamily)
MTGAGIETAAASLAGLLSEEAGDGRGRIVAVERHATGPGVMPPLHRRDEDESYHVLEGSLTFFVEDEVRPAAAGEVVVAPRGARRTFRVESRRARWVVLTRAGSPSRFEDFGRALACPAGGWSSEDEAARVAALGAPNGIEVLGPPGSLPSER